MKKPLLLKEELTELGFTIKGTFPLEDGDYYTWFCLKKNDSEIHITYEYNRKAELTSYSVEFNTETLKGRNLTKEDIILLIEIM
ncbi:hypothetical protein [Flavobacterium covae]|uniref:hypothetical protein n=1 Tax=Flavobacterium covae TaxID=2906076 RepID=UPI000745F185|nr:hypothetical protein [Flavobacterium covae]AMA49430.1 hypothetical protein AWN65_08155 [Flavobacterium covae]MCJ1808964.1 hypothetical protein [Flavobacterium covae]